MQNSPKFVEHLTGLRAHLRRRVACEHDVHDLAQEACLKLLQARKADAIRRPRAYLYQIANNLLYQHYTGRGPTP